MQRFLSPESGHRELVLSGAIRAIQSSLPWLVTVDFRVHQPRDDCAGGEWKNDRVITVEMSPLAQSPDIETLIPRGAEFVRADIFPVTQFDRMNPDVRDRYASHYRVYLMWRRAVAVGSDVAVLVDGQDYSSRALDESVQRWVSYGFAEAEDA